MIQLLTPLGIPETSSLEGRANNTKFPSCQTLEFDDHFIMMANADKIDLQVSRVSFLSVHGLDWRHNYKIPGESKVNWQCFSVNKSRDIKLKFNQMAGDSVSQVVMDSMSDIQNCYTTIGKIGEGTFGQVHVAYDNIHKQNVAIKVLKQGAEDDSADEGIKYGMVEVEMLSKLSGFVGPSKKLCVEILDWYTTDDVFQIVFPLYGENLLSFRERNKNHTHFLIEDVRSIAHQLCHAVRFLHRNGMIHTDVKLCNIVFVDRDYYEYEVTYDNFHNLDGTPMSQKILRVRRPLIKLIDFGSAVWSPAKETKYCHSINTRVYRAPEVILRLDWDKFSDVWSIACTIFELLYGQSLFDTDDDLEHLGLIEKSIERFPESMINASPLQGCFDSEGNVIVNGSDMAEIVDEQDSLKNYVLRVGGPEYSELYDLLEKMFHVDPAKRISLCRAVYHHFFTCKPFWITDE